MRVFFTEDDRHAYLSFVREQAAKHGLHVLAWCLMDNHVHLVAVPQAEDSLAKGLGEAHKRYTRRVNFRHDWRGYLFQGRFYSCPLVGNHAIAAIQYVLQNPVRAGLCSRPWDYRWSNARWLVGRSDADPLAKASPLLEEVEDWTPLLLDAPDGVPDLRKHTRTGRPLCDDVSLRSIEARTGRELRRRKPGRKPGKPSCGSTGRK